MPQEVNDFRLAEEPPRAEILREEDAAFAEFEPAAHADVRRIREEVIERARAKAEAERVAQELEVAKMYVHAAEVHAKRQANREALAKAQAELEALRQTIPSVALGLKSAPPAPAPAPVPVAAAAEADDAGAGTPAAASVASAPSPVASEGEVTLPAFRPSYLDQKTVELPPLDVPELTAEQQQRLMESRRRLEEAAVRYKKELEEAEIQEAHERQVWGGVGWCAVAWRGGGGFCFELNVIQ